MRPLAFLVSCLLFVTSCATELWENALSPDANFEKDKHECGLETDQRHVTDTRASQGSSWALEVQQCLKARGWRLVQKEPVAPGTQGTGARVPVMLDANIPNAEVYVDGGLVGTTPLSYPLSIGPHRIEFRKPSYVSWARELQVATGSRVVAELVPIE